MSSPATHRLGQLALALALTVALTAPSNDAGGCPEIDPVHGGYTLVWEYQYGTAYWVCGYGEGEDEHRHIVGIE